MSKIVAIPSTSYHFIGIGGIGMSGLAQILRARGFSVQGSDKAQTSLTEELKRRGIEVFSSHDPAHVFDGTTVVYSSDIKSSHPEYQAAISRNRPILHRSQLLAELMKDHIALLVAGTHGKTTTSALLAHVLMQAKQDPSFAIGGISLDYETNSYQGKGRFFVAEADESDGSFLNLRAEYGIITNLEEDHLSFWQNQDRLIEGFRTFASQVKNSWWCADDPILKKMQPAGKSYGFSSDADLRITHCCQKGWSLLFDLEIKGKKYEGLEVLLIGEHNVLNAASVFGLCLDLGLSEGEIREGLKSFKGVKRRMEKRGEKRGVVVLDDYAHHPTEIKTTLRGLRKAVGKKQIVAIFQPHRYARFQDCWDDFLTCFDSADTVFVTDVYGAGEEAIENITADRFAISLQKNVPTFFAKRSELLEAVGNFLRPHDVVITLGAGDITHLELLSCPIKPFQMTILQGGKSSEHEVSLSSTLTVVASLNPEFYQFQTWTISKGGKWPLSFPEAVSHLLTQDIVFPVLHGPFGEDGMIQGFLETLSTPYVGCDFRSCVVAMDKVWTKQIARDCGVSIARFLDFSIEEWQQDRDNINKKN